MVVIPCWTSKSNLLVILSSFVMDGIYQILGISCHEKFSKLVIIKLNDFSRQGVDFKLTTEASVTIDKNCQFNKVKFFYWPLQRWQRDSNATPQNNSTVLFFKYGLNLSYEKYSTKFTLNDKSIGGVLGLEPRKQDGRNRQTN